jgi:hypothetical protein
MVTHITKTARCNYNRRKENRITVSSRILSHNNLYTETCSVQWRNNIALSTLHSAAGCWDISLWLLRLLWCTGCGCMQHIPYTTVYTFIYYHINSMQIESNKRTTGCCKHVPQHKNTFTSLYTTGTLLLLLTSSWFCASPWPVHCWPQSQRLGKLTANNVWNEGK